jgi:fructokinase
VDFVSTRPGFSLQQALLFEKAAGGAPANVAVGLSRLGTRVSFVGEVGDDPFGRFLVRELRGSGVDTSGMKADRRHRTRLAFVSLTKRGERDFSFWEATPADEHLRLADLELRTIAASRIVHISSFLLINRTTRTVALRLAAALRRRGCLVSFDPNLRMSLWRSPREVRSVTRGMVRRAQILRLNIEEAQFLTGTKHLQTAASALRRLGPELVVITDGAKGCTFFTRTEMGEVPGFRVRVVDTTGCGDAFLAGLLHEVARRTESPGNIPGYVMYSICRFSNATGALTAMHRGAAAAMPTRLQVKRFLTRRP